MTFRNRNPLFALIAITGAALSMPAMAQNTQDAQKRAVDAQTRSAPPAQTAADTATSAGAQSWGSLDADGDGTISKSEAQAHAGLAQIFDQADTDGDGRLTPEEYKAYVDAQQN